MPRPQRHKVFVSYHHENDQGSRNRFELLFAEAYDIMDSRSVTEGAIPRGLTLDEVSRRIRDDYLRDSTVTVVLVGVDTWRRKHVDWEIAASLRETAANPRSGLLGILLPTHACFNRNSYDPYTIPPRLHYNLECGFAELYSWSESPEHVITWIDRAYRRRRTIIPDNSSVKFAKNWRGPRWFPQNSAADNR